MARPEAKTSLAEKEMDKVEKQFEAYDEQVKQLTKDRMDMAPVQETEPQTKIASRELDKMRDIYLKPERTISCRDKFNEDYRKDYEFAKEYVHFIAEHKELIGECIEIWTRPFAGMPAEFWKVPTNKPIWGPRYLAEQIKTKSYHRLKMEQNTTGADGMGQYYGTIAVDTSIQRLDANPVTKKRSIFMGATTF
jgi:hypothetical protein